VVILSEGLVDKRKLKTRLVSKKKRPAVAVTTENAAEKSSRSEVSSAPDNALSTRDDESSIFSAELNELQKLLQQKRCQLELMQDDETPPATSSVVVIADLDTWQHTQTGICRTNCGRFAPLTFHTLYVLPIH